MPAEAQVESRPRLLFVDDEQRVLNSMRIMFRRNFELFLASHGAEALEIVRDKDIDVIVADHRMPKMTGVEVLSKVRALSPRTVRILLTGYADLDAVEGSINQSEVFRFLTKPCPPQKLRETIELAAKLARETPAPNTPNNLSPAETLEIVMESDTVTEVERNARPTQAEHQQRTGTTAILEKPKLPQQLPPTLPAAPTATRSATSARRLTAAGLGVIVFSVDDEVISSVQQAVRGRIPVYTAGNVVQVVKILQQHKPGVLVTDISEDKATIQSMTARLKEHLPELVTIAVSQHRDVLDMVWLINHGQIFRFLRKPLSAGRCAVSLQAALQHHRQLLKHPELVKRHEVAASGGDSGIMDGVLSTLRTVKRLWGDR